MCGTRYYDPETGRFINSDDISYLDPNTINGSNLYAYCLNNPVMMVDPNGNFPFFILTMLIGAVAGVGIGYATGARGTSLIWWGIGGAIVGAVAGMAISYYATGSAFSSVGSVWSGLFGKTTLYRTLSVDDFAQLEATGKLSATSETFVSPNLNYAQGYNGATVEFQIRNRTMMQLEKIGVRDASKIVTAKYPNMQLVSKGWKPLSAYFKEEGAFINIGLGNGNALAIFNKGIVSFVLI